MYGLFRLITAPFRWVFGVLRWLLRAIGILLLVCAFASLVVDASRSIAKNEFALTPAGQTWYDIDRDSIGLAQAAIQRYTFPAIWDPGIQTVLTWPTVAVLGVPGLVLLLLTWRRRRRRDD